MSTPPTPNFDEKNIELHHKLMTLAVFLSAVIGEQKSPDLSEVKPWSNFAIAVVREQKSPDLSPSRVPFWGGLMGRFNGAV